MVYLCFVAELYLLFCRMDIEIRKLRSIFNEYRSIWECTTRKEFAISKGNSLLE